ncbi:MAG: hypothetical protein GX149_04855 [Acholeplasmataceae bacterium]|jgi:hypothetical protein|nr:hypothetical protein [Acholeplasmataceae bacterium]
MRKIKNFFLKVGQTIVNPIKTIASIIVSDRFLIFMNKHVWLKLLISAVLTAGIIVLVYVVKVKF